MFEHKDKTLELLKSHKDHIISMIESEYNNICSKFNEKITTSYKELELDCSVLNHNLGNLKLIEENIKLDKRDIIKDRDIIMSMIQQYERQYTQLQNYRCDQYINIPECSSLIDNSNESFGKFCDTYTATTIEYKNIAKFNDEFK